MFFPWWAPSSLSWLAGVLLVSGRWFAFLVPWSCLALSFSGDVPSTVPSSPSSGRGRRVPAPGGRDDGPDARAPTQAPALFEVSLYERRVRFKPEVRLHAYVGLVVFFALFSLFLFFFVLVVDFP